MRELLAICNSVGSLAPPAVPRCGGKRRRPHLPTGLFYGKGTRNGEFAWDSPERREAQGSAHKFSARTSAALVFSVVSPLAAELQHQRRRMVASQNSQESQAMASLAAGGGQGGARGWDWAPVPTQRQPQLKPSPLPCSSRTWRSTALLAVGRESSRPVCEVLHGGKAPSVKQALSTPLPWVLPFSL